jgi:NitT/TauT family transport system permease protein
MATTLLGVLLADLYVSDNGVGYFIKFYTDTQQGPRLFGLVVILAMAAVIINSAVGRFERYASRWML